MEADAKNSGFTEVASKPKHPNPFFQQDLGKFNNLTSQGLLLSIGRLLSAGIQATHPYHKAFQFTLGH